MVQNLGLNLLLVEIKPPLGDWSLGEKMGDIWKGLKEEMRGNENEGESGRAKKKPWISFGSKNHTWGYGLVIVKEPGEGPVLA